MFSKVSSIGTRISGDRIQLSRKLSDREIDALASDKTIRYLQFFNRPDESVWGRLNEGFFKARPEVCLRVYGFADDEHDLDFCAQMTAVRDFAVELGHASGLEHIAAMRELKSIHITMCDPDCAEILRHVSSRLTSISITGGPAASPLDLGMLARFGNLRKLYLERHKKGISVIAELRTLEDLTLRSVTLKSFDFLRELPALWSLDIKLGGTKDLGALEGLTGLKYLELWKIAGLTDISVISTLTGLQFLFLQELRQIHALPPLAALSRLRKVHMDTMNGLKDIQSLFEAPVLEEIAHIANTTIPVEVYASILKKTTLKRIHVGFCADRKNARFAKLVEGRGLPIPRGANYVDFEFF
jgi:Leucine-rich repeat (LRR) protein